jgi:hypothetical protein
MSQQFIAENAMIVVAHAPYSLALIPSGFYPFRHVKDLVRGESFETGEQLLSAIEDILRSSEKWTLTKVFLVLMTRLERSIETNCDWIS